jgi:hypothetical protein
MLAETIKKHYISVTMSNTAISYISYAFSLIAVALFLRKSFALRLLALRANLR